MGFLGDDGIEVRLGNNTILVKIGSLDHFLVNIVIRAITEILGDFSEILESNESCVILLNTSLL